VVRNLLIIELVVNCTVFLCCMHFLFFSKHNISPVGLKKVLMNEAGWNDVGLPTVSYLLLLFY
jgi:hypothetical protein